MTDGNDSSSEETTKAQPRSPPALPWHTPEEFSLWLEGVGVPNGVSSAAATTSSSVAASPPPPSSLAEVVRETKNTTFSAFHQRPRNTSLPPASAGAVPHEARPRKVRKASPPVLPRLAARPGDVSVSLARSPGSEPSTQDGAGATGGGLQEQAMGIPLHSEEKNSSKPGSAIERRKERNRESARKSRMEKLKTGTLNGLREKLDRDVLERMSDAVAECREQLEYDYNISDDQEVKINVSFPKRGQPEFSISIE
mmetsp:Transcript_19063/g.46796  ORF Transcript_19063/g.46796 Transcript_19063/m.46796 type:complete len:254 (-) Transcript_19063:165-926(-)